MTPRERVRSAMFGKAVDRFPVFPVTTRNLGARTMGLRVGEMVLDPRLYFKGIASIKERFGFDGLECGFGPSRGFERREPAVIDGVAYLTDADGKPTARFQEDDDPVALDHTPPIREKANLSIIKVTPASSYEEAGHLDAIRELRAAVGDGLSIAGCAAGQTMNSLAMWRGSEQALLDLIDDPVFVDEAMDLATDISIECGKAFVAAGVDGIYMGDAWSSASIISPKQFERFCLPRYSRAAQAFHSMGVYVYLHICGNASPILELMADTGVDALEPLDPLGGVDMADAVRRVGHRVSLKGGVDTMVLLRGSPDDVRRETLKVLDAAAGKCRGLLVGSGDDIPRDTPFENLDAMVETVYGYAGN